MASITSLGLLAALCLAMRLASAAAPTNAWSLLPQPAEARLTAGKAIEIANGSAIDVRGADRRQVQDIVQRFVQLVADTRGLQLRMAAAADVHPPVTFEVDPHADVVGDAGYRIVVDDHGLLVTARTPQGVFYGSVTVWQLLTPSGWNRGSAADIAAGIINDHPRFAWRALLLDSGRHFQSVAEIKQLIDWMSLNKLNVLVWHLTEDQGWRIEIPAYPELTRIGACRKAVGLDIELTGTRPTKSVEKMYCGFYTAADVRQIVRYAAQRFVTVVPDIDLPGHMQAAVASYPWLGVTGQRPPVWSEWGISPWLLTPDEKTLHFVDAVLDEVMRLFPSPYVSIGGDEAAKDQWNASPEVRAQMRKHGFDNMDQLQGWFTQQVADHLIKHGRRPVGWDDQLVAGATLPSSEVVMSWHGADGERVALDALRQGHDVVMTPQESLYFDHYQSDLADEGPGQPPMATLQQAYATAVVPQGATAAQAQHILGVQACLWTELMPSFARGQHAVFPRIAALSELAWSPANLHDWNGLLERMPSEMARYRALGIGYADSAFAPTFALTAATGGKLRAVISKQVEFGDIRYTTDGSAPTADSPQYAQALQFPAHDKMTLRAATFAPDGFALSAPRTQVVDAGALLSRNGNELVPCSDHAEMMRLGSSSSPQSPWPTYKVDVGNMCWRWPQAPSDGVKRVVLTVGRVAWQFGDEAAHAIVRPKAGAAGEFEIHVDDCKGPLLATVPLSAAAAAASGQAELMADVSTPGANTTVRDVCVIATGDPREGQWTLARMTFSRGDAQ